MTNDHKSKTKDFFQNIDIEFLIHELKDPIAVIETGARTLIEKQDKFGVLSSRQSRTMNRILRNTRIAREMLYSLLEVGRSEAGSFTCNKFNPVATTLDVLTNCLELKIPRLFDIIQQQNNIENVLTQLKTNNILITTDIEINTAVIQQDELKFRQVIGNLIKNALHFKREQIEIKISKQDDALKVAVIDDGPGVAPEDFEAIFERYSQSNDCTIDTRQGHGLGLAGARIMARCLGGDITLTCTETEGTKFELTLPSELGSSK